MWSMGEWVSAASVTEAGSIPAATSRLANCPARGKPGNSVPSPESTRTVRPPLRTPLVTGSDEVAVLDRAR